MRHHRMLLTVMGLMFMALLMGCSQSTKEEIAAAKANEAELTKDVKVAVADQQAAAREVEWLKFKNEAEIQISLNDKSIVDYKISMTGTNGTRRAKYDNKIEALELKNKELRARLVKYPDSGKSNWEQFRNEFSHDMTELGSALKDFTVNNEN